MLSIRNLLPHERPLIREHLLKLDAEDRASRFGGVMGDQAVVHYVESLRWFERRMLGCVEDGQLVGLAELVWIPPGARTGRFRADAELAVSVLRDCRRAGLGGALVARALTVARNRNCRRVHMICLPANYGMQALARQFSAEMSLGEGGVAAYVTLPPPTPASLTHEALVSGAAGMLRVIEGLRPEPAAAAA